MRSPPEAGTRMGRGAHAGALRGAATDVPLDMGSIAQIRSGSSAHLSEGPTTEDTEGVSDPSERSARTTSSVRSVSSVVNLPSSVVTAWHGVHGPNCALAGTADDARQPSRPTSASPRLGVNHLPADT